MSMNVPFLDLRLSEATEREVLMGAMESVLKHGRLVMGPEITQFETTIAAYCGRKFCVSVGSGTDALFLSLKALRLGPGDEVITTALSWVATANAIALTGATPVFADIQDDLNICPRSVESLVTKRTKAILAVDYTGKICDMDALESICQRHGLLLVEDGSQAFGATRKGRRCGSFGTVAAISHNPMKVFAALGEAGSILCDDEALYERLVALRYNGTVNRETCIEPSLNGRMDTLQAAVLLKRLDHLDALLQRRNENARYYAERLDGLLKLPAEDENGRQVYYTYTVQTPARDELEQYLADTGIETKVQHRLLMPEAPAYKPGVRGNYPNALALSRQILSIPVHEKLTEAQRCHVADSIEAFVAKRKQ
jgi:dTDP-4-amino-4,6-dideoxygalactose transaminase